MFQFCEEREVPMVRAAVLACLLLTFSAFAQSAPEKPKALKIPYENANSIVKFDCTYVTLESNGKSTSWHHYRTALLTDRAVRENAQDVTTYNLGYDTVEVVTAQVHLPNGKTVNVDSASIKDVPLPAFGKFYLQNVREKIITFPQLEQGAEIEIAYKEKTRNVPMDGQFDFSDGFQSDDPVQQKYVEIVAPKNMKLKWKARGGDIPYSANENGDRVKHVWAMQNIIPLIPEPGMPPAPEVYKMLLVTTVPDWNTWSRWYNNLSEPEMVADDSVKATVKELIAGKTSADAKAKAIFYFCSNQIRYVETALTGRKAGYKPEPAAVTYRNKYGVCRDKAALMVTMLREAGIPAEITLMNPSWKIDGDIPVDQFNHAIVAATLDGKTVYMDPTVEKNKDFMAANEQDRAVLVCNKKGEDLAWTPLESSDQNLYEIHALSRLNDAGDFRSHVVITTKGFADLILRNFVQALSPEHRLQTFKQLVQGLYPTALLDTFTVSDGMDFSKTMEITLDFHAPSYSTVAGKYLLFKAPNQSSGLDFLSRSLMRGTELTKRRTDLRLHSTFAVRADETVTYPKGYKVRSLPETLDLQAEGFRLARKVDVSGNTVHVSRVLDVSTLSVPLDRFDKLQELLKKNDLLARGQVVLTKI
jgi:transglutaminase-like putative cysteine protease